MSTTTGYCPQCRLTGPCVHNSSVTIPYVMTPTGTVRLAEYRGDGLSNPLRRALADPEIAGMLRAALDRADVAERAVDELQAENEMLREQIDELKSESRHARMNPIAKP